MAAAEIKIQFLFFIYFILKKLVERIKIVLTDSYERHFENSKILVSKSKFGGAVICLK